MNAALRIQIIADARNARAQLRSLGVMLKSLQKLTGMQGSATTQATRLAKAQASVATAHARATKAQNQAAASAARVQSAQNQAAASANRVVTAQNQAAASASRAQAAQNNASAATARAAASSYRAQAGIQGLATSLSSVSAVAPMSARALDMVSNAIWRLEGASMAMAGFGRAMSFWLTLPIALTFGLATRNALEYERAMTRLRKVYDGNIQDVEKLSEGFMMLSSIFGTHAEDVANIGAKWAQAGAQGGALLKLTELTQKAMILGEFETSDQAVEGMITLLNAYRLSVDELEVALAHLNAIENVTAADFPDLIEAIGDAGGVAREAGVPIRNLAADIAVLRSNGQSASEAGQSLKILYQRLMDPPVKGIKALNRLGIEFNTVEWQSKNASERMDDFAMALDGVAQSEKVVAAGAVFGRRQASRAIQVMQSRVDALSEGLGVYSNALNAAETDAEAMAKANKEVQELLDSDPRMFERALNHLRNVLMQIAADALPAVIEITMWIAKLADSFSKLDPSTRRWILTIILALALLGPFMFIMAKIIALVAGLLTGIKGLIWVFAALGPVLKAAALGIGIVVGAIGGTATAIIALIALVGILVYVFRDDIVDAMTAAYNAIVGAFLNLPETFRNLMRAVGRIVWTGVKMMPEAFFKAMKATLDVVIRVGKAILRALSYLNPFARHSPSLVDNVQNGMSVISKTMGDTADDVSGSMDKVAGSVDGVSDALDAQKAKVEAARDHLEDLRDALSDVEEQLGDAKERLNAWLRTPVTGTYAFEDAAFANTQAQKGLELQIARLELMLHRQGTSVDEVRNAMEEQAKAAADLADANAAVGTSFSDAAMSADDAQQRMGRLQAEIERLRGQELDLRMAGAGSDVLGGIKAQIADADAARKELAQIAGSGGSDGGFDFTQEQADAVKQIDELARQLEGLKLEGTILDLEEVLQLGPARKAIQDTQRVAEQSLDVILAGIAKESAAIEELTKKRDAAAAAVKAQEEVVDSLSDAYDRLSDAAGGAGAALDDLAAGDFGVPGGVGGGLGDLADMDIDGMLEEWEKELENLFGDFDPWQTIKDKLNEAWEGIKGWFSDLWEGIKSWASGQWEPMVEDFKKAWERIKIMLKQLGFDWDAAMTGLETVWEKGWEAIELVVPNAWDRIETAASGGWEVLKGIFKMGQGVMEGDWDKFWEGMKMTASGSLSILEAIVGRSWDDIKRDAKVAWTATWATIQLTWNQYGAPALRRVTGWLQTNFVNPLLAMKDGIVRAFGAIGRGVGAGVSGIKGAVAGPLNGAIGIINRFSSGVNWVAQKLGSGFRVPMIGYVSAGSRSGGNRYFASGGVMPASEVGNGFVTDGPRAIVGEGNPRHPEYVIPTDPKYRSRAMALLEGASKAIGLAKGGKIPVSAKTPAFGIGGILSNVANKIMGSLSKTMVRSVYKVWDRTVENSRGSAGRLGGIGGGFARGALEKLIGAGGRKINDMIGTWFRKAKDRIFGIFSRKQTYRRLKTQRSRVSGGASFMEQGGVVPPYVYSMMQGALVKGGRGGVLAHIGDGRKDELVQPLNGNASAGGERTLVFNGDLVFPNVTNGDDVESFLENLESLAETT